MGFLLGDLEGTGDGSSHVVAAQDAHGDHIAAGLSGRGGGGGVDPPAAGKAGVEVVDAALVVHGQAVIGEDGIEVEVLGLLDGELAVGDFISPDQVGAAQAHPHQQETHAHAGVVVLAVGDHGHGVQTDTVGGAEGDAHAVQNAGQLVDDGHDLAEGAGVDVQLFQQVLGVEQITQLAHGDAVVEHLRQGLLAGSLQGLVDELENQGVLSGVAVGQVQVDAGGHVAGDAGVDGVQVKLVGGVGGDEAIGDGVAGKDVSGVDLHGHVGLVDGDGALGGAGLVLGAAVVGDQNSLVLTRAHLGEAAQLNILGDAGNAGDGVNLALNGHPLGQGVAADDVVQAGDLVQDVVHVQIHAGLGVGQLGLVLDGEVVDGQGLTGGESGVVPVNEVVKDGLLHDGGVHVVGEGHAALEGHHAGQTAVGGGHFHSDGVAAVGLGLRHGDADLPLALAELHQAGDVGLVQGLVADVGRTGLVGVVLHGHLVGGDSGGSGVHHGLIDGRGGGGVVIALVIGELHAHLVGAIVQVELDLLTVLDGNGGLNGGGGVGLVAGVEDADLLLTGGDGGIAQATHNGLTLQGQPLGVQISDALVVVLDGHVAGFDDIGRLHHGVEDGSTQSIVVHLQVGIHGQGHGVGGLLHGVGSLGPLGDGDGGLGGGAVDGVGTGVRDADLLLTLRDGGVGHRNAKHSVLTALQGHPFLACITDRTGGSGGVVLNGHVRQGQLGGGGGHHGVEDSLPQSVEVDGGIFGVGQSHGAALVQGDGRGLLGNLSQGDFGIGTLNADLIAAVLIVRQSGVSKGSGDKHNSFLAGKAVDRAPGIVGQQAVLTGAVVLPAQALGVNALFVHDQRVKQGLLDLLRSSIGGNNGSVALELGGISQGDGLLHGGGLVGPGPPGGGGGQGSALDQGQGGQHSSQSPAQGMGTFHNNPSSHVLLTQHPDMENLGTA